MIEPVLEMKERKYPAEKLYKSIKYLVITHEAPRKANYVEGKCTERKHKQLHETNRAESQYFPPSNPPRVNVLFILFLFIVVVLL